MKNHPDYEKQQRYLQSEMKKIRQKNHQLVKKKLMKMNSEKLRKIVIKIYNLINRRYESEATDSELFRDKLLQDLSKLFPNP